MCHKIISIFQNILFATISFQNQPFFYRVIPLQIFIKINQNGHKFSRIILRYMASYIYNFHIGKSTFLARRLLQLINRPSCSRTSGVWNLHLSSHIYLCHKRFLTAFIYIMLSQVRNFGDMYVKKMDKKWQFISQSNHVLIIQLGTFGVLIVLKIQ